MKYFPLDRPVDIVLLLSLIFLALSWFLIYFGVKPLWPLRSEPVWPLVALVSVPEGTSPDVLSSVPGILSVALAAFQSLFFVEIAKIILIQKIRVSLFQHLLLLSYELSVVVDWFRVWSYDWFVWGLYRLHLGKLCRETDICYPTTGTFPLVSLFFLSAILIFGYFLDWLKLRPKIK
jgi:hypothetical protein